jgi:hypothetical protein
MTRILSPSSIDAVAQRAIERGVALVRKQISRLKRPA